MIQNIFRNHRSLFISLLLLLSILLVILIAQLIVYFKMDADRSLMLQQEKIENIGYNPVQNWTLNVEADSLLVKDLKNDYKAFWWEKYRAEKFSDSSRIQYYISEGNTSHLPKTYEAKKIQNHTFYLSQSPTLSYFSKDGHLAVIEDNALEFIEEKYHKDQLIDKKWKKAKTYSVWVLSSGIWQCRHLWQKELEEKKTTQLSLPKNFQLRNNTIWKDGSVFNTKGTNYYPQNQAWKDMWTNYNEAVIQEDLKKMKEAGLNTVRVFLSYDELGKDKVSAKMMKNFEKFLDTSQSQGIYVIPTLFDFFSDYSLEYYTQTDQHLKILLEKFKNHPAILAWDLKNEPDLDFKNHSQNKVLGWLQFISDRAKQYDPNHMITIGWSDGKYASLLQNEIHLISYHYYKKPSDFGREYTQLKSKIANKPIMVSEFGTPSYEAFWYPFSKNENQQLAYYQNMFSAFREAKMPHFIHWTLYDFSEVPNKVVGAMPWRKNLQKNFGFIDKDGQPKKAYTTIAGEINETENINLWQKTNSFHLLFTLSFLLFIVVFYLLVKKYNKKKRLISNLVKI